MTVTRGGQPHASTTTKFQAQDLQNKGNDEKTTQAEKEFVLKHKLMHCIIFQAT